MKVAVPAGAIDLTQTLRLGITTLCGRRITVPSSQVVPEVTQKDLFDMARGRDPSRYLRVDGTLGVSRKGFRTLQDSALGCVRTFPPCGPSSTFSSAHFQHVEHSSHLLSVIWL